MVKKLSYINALRAYAVLAVIMVHVGLRFEARFPEWANAIVVQGARGVQLFFILSAITLFLSMAFRSSRGDTDLVDFFLRRFFRIAPLFYLATILYTVRDMVFNHFLGGGYPEFHLANFLSTFAFLTNNLNPHWINQVVPGGWSITAEMAFYLFAPFLFKKIKNIRSASMFFLGSLGVMILMNGVYAASTHEIIAPDVLRSYLFYWFPNQLPVFALGIVSFFLIEKTQDEQIKTTTGYTLITLALVGAIVLSQLNISDNINYILYSILFVFVVWVFSRSNLKIFDNKVTSFVGKLSFSMYLTHFLVIQLVGVITPSLGLSVPVEFLVHFSLTTIITIGVSYLSFRLIENPGIELGKRIIARRSEKITPAN